MRRQEEAKLLFEHATQHRDHLIIPIEQKYQSKDGYRTWTNFSFTVLNQDEMLLTPGDNVGLRSPEAVIKTARAWVDYSIAAFEGTD